MIDPADVLDSAIGTQSGAVAAAIQALTAAKRIGDETFGAQTRLGVITPRQARTTDVQLAHRTLRQQVHLIVENIQASSCQRLANRHAAP